MCNSVILTTNDLATGHNRNSQADMAILDLGEDFDKVLHERLLAKLDHYGYIGPQQGL